MRLMKFGIVAIVILLIALIASIWFAFDRYENDRAVDQIYQSQFRN